MVNARDCRHQLSSLWILSRPNPNQISSWAHRRRLQVGLNVDSGPAQCSLLLCVGWGANTKAADTDIRSKVMTASSAIDCRPHSSYGHERSHPPLLREHKTMTKAEQMEAETSLVQPQVEWSLAGQWQFEDARLLQEFQGLPTVLWFFGDGAFCASEGTQ